MRIARIHGELLRLGIEIRQAKVSKYRVRRRKSPSRNGRTFLQNQAKDIVSIDFITVPTATSRVLFVFLVLGNERRRVLHWSRHSVFAGRSRLATLGVAEAAAAAPAVAVRGGGRCDQSRRCGRSRADRSAR